MGNAVFITHKGKRILHIVLGLLSEEEILQAIAEARTVIAKEPHGSVLTLTDVRQGHFNDRISEALKAYVKHNKPFVKAAAVVGASGLKKVVLLAVAALSGRKLSVFEDAEEAKNWLAAQP